MKKKNSRFLFLEVISYAVDVRALITGVFLLELEKKNCARSVTRKSKCLL